jgi:hypothetical protein
VVGVWRNGWISQSATNQQTSSLMATKTCVLLVPEKVGF